MARRGLQALHEICAGDPEGVAVPRTVNGTGHTARFYLNRK